MTAALESPNVVAVAAWGEDDRGHVPRGRAGAGRVALAPAQGGEAEPGGVRRAHGRPSSARRSARGLAAAHALRGDGRRARSASSTATSRPATSWSAFDGIVKIVDFGIAKAEERITHTRTGTLKGKPAYMAPEQARGGKVDARADIFSFGVMLFELLAGRRPVDGEGRVRRDDGGLDRPRARHPHAPQGAQPACSSRSSTGASRRSPRSGTRAPHEIQAELDAWRAAKGFAGDDPAVARAVRRRNATRQLAWFAQALQGDFARGDAPTFKELEEHIDQARSGSGSAPAVRPAAGAPAQPDDSGRKALQSLAASPARRADDAEPRPSRPAQDLGHAIAVDDADVQVVAASPTSPPRSRAALRAAFVRAAPEVPAERPSQRGKGLGSALSMRVRRVQPRRGPGADSGAREPRRHRIHGIGCRGGGPHRARRRSRICK